MDLRWTIALALAWLLASATPEAGAQTRAEARGAATPARPAAAPPTAAPPPAAVPRPLADLTCVIEVWKDEAKTKPIANGASIGNPSARIGIPAFAHIDVSVKNGGQAVAGPFHAALTVEGVFPPITQSHVVPAGLGPGIGYHFPLLVVAYGKPADVRVRATADVGGHVTEVTDRNNLCSFRFTVPD